MNKPLFTTQKKERPVDEKGINYCSCVSGWEGVWMVHKEPSKVSCFIVFALCFAAAWTTQISGLGLELGLCHKMNIFRPLNLPVVLCHWPIVFQYTVKHMSWAAFLTMFRVTGGFWINFWRHRRLYAATSCLKKVSWRAFRKCKGSQRSKQKFFYFMSRQGSCKTFKKTSALNIQKKHWFDFQDLQKIFISWFPPFKKLSLPLDISFTELQFPHIYFCLFM